MNARSVRNKTTDILDHIHEHNLDIDLPVIRDFMLLYLKPGSVTKTLTSQLSEILCCSI